MNKFYKCRASTQMVGTEETWKIEAKDEEGALFLFADTAMEYIDSWEHEEEGVEPEYDYTVHEITEEEYRELEVDIIE